MSKNWLSTALAGISSAIALGVPITSAYATSNFIGYLDVDVGAGVAHVALYSDKRISDAGPIDITSIWGNFREIGTGGKPDTYFTSLTLDPANSGPFGDLSSGDGPTDNKILSPSTLIANPTAAHLTTGGFIFSYSVDPNDSYQLYYAGGSYQGCWSVGGDCAPRNVIFSVPEPSTWTLMFFGIGGVGAASRFSRRRGRVGLERA